MKHPSNGEVILIDFGSAHFVEAQEELDTSNNNKTELRGYEGSIEFAADEILENL